MKKLIIMFLLLGCFSGFLKSKEYVLYRCELMNISMYITYFRIIYDSSSDNICYYFGGYNYPTGCVYIDFPRKDDFIKNSLIKSLEWYKIGMDNKIDSVIKEINTRNCLLYFYTEDTLYFYNSGETDVTVKFYFCYDNFFEVNLETVEYVGDYNRTSIMNIHIEKENIEGIINSLTNENIQKIINEDNERIKEEKIKEEKMNKLFK